MHTICTEHTDGVCNTMIWRCPWTSGAEIHNMAPLRACNWQFRVSPNYSQCTLAVLLSMIALRDMSTTYSCSVRWVLAPSVHSSRMPNWYILHGLAQY